MGKHAPAGRKFDESLTALRKALMVAGKATPSIGIKLRGSDKQSSIWHHKEKQ